MVDGSPRQASTTVVGRRAILKYLAAGGVLTLLQACGGSSAQPTTGTAAGGGVATTGAQPTTAPASGTTAASGGAAPTAAGAASPATTTGATAAATTGAATSATSGTRTASPGASPVGGAALPTAPSGMAPGGYPIYYPADYAAMVEAAKKEQKLQIYSIMSEKNWKPVVDGFQQRYPGITVQTVDLGSSEVFTRYYPEAASGARTADMIITSAADAWQDFIKRGELADYKSPEDPYLPAWSKPAPGIYAASSDPQFFIYNKKLLPNPPKTMAEFVAAIGKQPDLYKGKTTSYAISESHGFAINWFWIKRKGEDGWKILEAIATSNPKFETSGGNMVNAALSGQAVFGYFVSAITVFPKFPASEAVLGYQMINDGTPVVVRGMGITKKAASPNAAKLMMDYIVSQAGQVAFAEGGLTAYRPDVSTKAKIHLDKLAADVGLDNLIMTSFDPELTDKTKYDAFTARWNKTFGR